MSGDLAEFSLTARDGGPVVAKLVAPFLRKRARQLLAVGETSDVRRGHGPLDHGGRRSFGRRLSSPVGAGDAGGRIMRKREVAVGRREGGRGGFGCHARRRLDKGG